MLTPPRNQAYIGIEAINLNPFCALSATSREPVHKTSKKRQTHAVFS